MVDPGQPVLVGDVDLVLQGFEPIVAGRRQVRRGRAAQQVEPAGRARFRQADWELAKRNLLRQVMQVRYPRAQLVESQRHGRSRRPPRAAAGGARQRPRSALRRAAHRRLEALSGHHHHQPQPDQAGRRIQRSGAAGVPGAPAGHRLLQRRGSERRHERAARREHRGDDRRTEGRRAEAGRRRPGDHAGAGAGDREQAEERLRRPRLFDQYRQPRPGHLRRPVRVRPAHEEQHHPRDQAPDRARRLLLPDHAERLQRQHRRRLRAQRPARRAHQRGHGRGAPRVGLAAARTQPDAGVPERAAQRRRPADPPAARACR